MPRRRSLRQTSSSMKFRGVSPGKSLEDPAHHPQGNAGRLARRLHQDSGFARLPCPDQTVFVHPGHRFGGRLVTHPVGEVLSAAVGEPGGNDQLLTTLPLQHDSRGHDFQADDLRAAVSVGCSLADPLKQRSIVGTCRVQPPAAPMGNLQGRLQQEQALLGCLRTNPGSFGTGRLQAVNLEGPAPGDPAVVLPGIAGLAGELEPAAALDAAVAMAVVTALTGEDPLQVQGEAGRAGPGGDLDGDAAHHGTAAEFGGQPNLAVSQGDDPTPAIHPGRPGIRQGETGLPGEVPLHPVAVSAGEQELLGSAPATQGNGRGLKTQGKKVGGGCGRVGA